jgi:tungstate transport system ATP-binding protein
VGEGGVDVIRAEGLSVRFGEVVALAPTTFEIADGDRVCFTGPNGSGKSTLLRVLAGLLSPTSGTLEGVLPPGRAVLVHQRPHLFRGTALSNVALGAHLAGGSEAAARDVLDALGVAAVAGRDVRALSGGERRRTAIARALARRPEVLLLDEPLADLDDVAAEHVSRALAAFRGLLVATSPRAAPAFAPRELRMGEIAAQAARR